MATKDWKPIRRDKTRLMYQKKNTNKMILVDKILASNWMVSVGNSANLSNLKQKQLSYMGNKVLGNWSNISTAIKNAKIYMRKH